MCSIILPNQLFSNNILCLISDIIYLIEDDKFFTDYPFHKQKLVLHRASMKSYFDYVKTQYSNKKIYYIDSINANQTYDKIFKSNNIIHIL